VLARGIDEALVDEALRGRMLPAALAHGDTLGVAREADRVGMHQRIMENHVGTREHVRGPQRQKVGRTRPGADQVDLAVAHRTGAVTSRRLKSGSGRSTEAW
jgi:hypothetical protein